MPIDDIARWSSAEEGPFFERKSALGRFGWRPKPRKAADPSADTSAWEREIDRIMSRLYGLTAEEIQIVEGERD